MWGCSRTSMTRRRRPCGIRSTISISSTSRPSASCGGAGAGWLLGLTAAALAASPNLEGFAGKVSDSGEGRWTILAGIDEAVPTPVLSAALYQRFSSRGQAEFADKLLSAMRFQFGGHVEKK